MGRQVLYVVRERCTACMKCVFTCSLVKDGVLDPTHARIRVVGRGDVALDVDLCRHCDPAPCAEVCEFGAIKVVNGTVVLVQERCTTCKACMSVCPFGAITDSGGGALIKCDLCGGDPECVKVCPHDALIFEPPANLRHRIPNGPAEGIKELLGGR
ncbi:MAG: 4Fe-4S dicluster domain-containing protein [Desulfurococcales archaeon]|nr:4Fe-4S dicluster domain-containing protein [Desulfurococcales archaeon]